MSNNKLMTTEELSKELKVTRETIFQYRKQGMPYIKLGPRFVRFDFEKVIEWFENYK